MRAAIAIAVAMTARNSSARGTPAGKGAIARHGATAMATNTGANK